MLLWADNIILTKYVEDSISNNENVTFNKPLKLIIEIYTVLTVI